MKSSEYLYGSGVSVEPIPDEFIMRRVETLEDHLEDY